MAAHGPPGGLLTPPLLGGQPVDGAAAGAPEAGRGRLLTTATFSCAVDAITVPAGPCPLTGATRIERSPRNR